MKKEIDRLPLKKGQIKKAVQAVQQFHAKWEEGNSSRKKSLLEDSSELPIFLSFTLKKIPELSNFQMIKVQLPHTLVTDVTEVCLITGDLDKRDKKADVEPTVQHYKELLAKHGVKNVTEVIPLRQLRTEYKPYEAKRNLSGAYDVFLADNKIAQCLPKVLGKFFFKKRKFPQQVDLRSPNLKSQLDYALSRTVFFLSGRGNTCTAEVARLGFSTRQIVENIDAAVKTLASKLPGAWKNINGFYIKTSRSVSIPMYMSLESGNEVELPVPEPAEDVEAEEVTTVRRNKVKVFADGRIVVIPNDESDVSEDSSGYSDYDDDDDDNNKKRLKKRETLGKRQNSVAETKCLESTVAVTVETKSSEEDDNEVGSALSKKRKLRQDVNVSVMKKKKLRKDINVSVMKKKKLRKDIDVSIKKNLREDIDVSIKKKKKLREDINVSINKKKEFTVEIDSGQAKSVMAKKKMNKGGFDVHENISIEKKKKKIKEIK